MIEWLKREIAYWRRVHGGKVDGITAVRPENGWYTRHRTDL
jgi:hypothetical protein